MLSLITGEIYGQNTAFASWCQQKMELLRKWLSKKTKTLLNAVTDQRQYIRILSLFLHKFQNCARIYGWDPRMLSHKIPFNNDVTEYKKINNKIIKHWHRWLVSRVVMDVI